MPDDDSFDPFLGRVGHGHARSMRGIANRIANLGRRRSHGPTESGFTGARTGRGSAVGALLSSRSSPASLTRRRVMVKASYLKLAGTGLAKATRHLNYLQRDGTTRQGERGKLYGPEQDAVDGKAFFEKCAQDRQQFRFIVSPEDGDQFDDLKSVVRRLMQQAERDLETKLDWVAIDHFNTANPHAHVVVRGKDERGHDLVIAPDYLTQGLRERATDLVQRDLGPRTEREIIRSRLSEIEADHFTSIDRELLKGPAIGGLIQPVHRDSIQQSLRAGRLQTLGRLGLAREEGRGRWRLDPELERKLRDIGRRKDRIRMMSRALRHHAPDRQFEAFAVHGTAEQGHNSVVGRVIERGLEDEHADRHYLIVDAIDGRHHYAPIGAAPLDDVEVGHIVRLSPTAAALRPSDHVIAGIAQSSAGRYSDAIHLAQDASASLSFVKTHVRRIEAVRKSTGKIVRDAGGEFHIRGDYLAIAKEHQEREAVRAPMRVALLADRALAELATHDGPTWLDQEIVADARTRLGSGFGREVGQTIALRLRWLVEQELAMEEEGEVRPKPGMVETLRKREFERTVRTLEKNLGVPHAAVEAGRVEGIYRQSVRIGTDKYAVIQKAKEFSLVPWKPALERGLGQAVSGRLRGGSISWELGRGRHMGIGM